MIFKQTTKYWAYVAPVNNSIQSNFIHTDFCYNQKTPSSAFIHFCRDSVKEKPAHIRSKPMLSFRPARHCCRTHISMTTRGQGSRTYM